MVGEWQSSLLCGVDAPSFPPSLRCMALAGGQAALTLVEYRGLYGGGMVSSGAYERGMLAAPTPRVLRREPPQGESERVLVAGDHGFLNWILGDGERVGLLIADHGLPGKPACGDGEESTYLSSSWLAMDDASSLVKLEGMASGFGMIFLNWRLNFGVGVVGVLVLAVPVDMSDGEWKTPACDSSRSRYSRACSAHLLVISGSMCMFPKSSESGGMQSSGKSLPKTGVNA